MLLLLHSANRGVPVYHTCRILLMCLKFALRTWYFSNIAYFNPLEPNLLHWYKEGILAEELHQSYY